MKNILFIGPYYQADGWGEAARQWIKALKTTGHNIQIRPVYFINKLVDDLEFEIKELEYTQLSSYDAVIQNVLPHCLEYDTNYGKNICLTAIETKKWNNVWPRKLEMMDAIWVPSEYSKQCIVDSTRDSCVKPEVIPIPVSSKFEGPVSKIQSDILQNKYVFYFIGEYIERKNLDMLVRAFHTEFHRSEPVELVIKTSRLGVEPADLREVIIERFSKIKEELCIYGNVDDYKSELIITDRLNDLEMKELHHTCNCFVMPSAGEAWSIPAADAVMLGNALIMTNTGCVSLANYVVNSRWTNVNTKDKPLANLFSGKELWLEADFMSLRKCLRTAYSSNALAMHQVDHLSYKAIGELMCQVL